jgi:hypothetical protein
MPEKYRPEGSSVEYTVPSLDDAADGPEAFRDFADSIPKSLSSAIPISNVAADYTLKATDDGGLVAFDCTAKDLTVTIPANATANLPVGSCIVVGCLGTNRKASLTITAADGVTLRDLAVRKVLWSRMAALIKIDADSWIINAGTGGGTPTSVPSPPALLTCAAGNMQIGVTWKAPTDDGGAALSAYLVEISSDQKTWDTGASTSPTSLAANVPVSKGGVTYYLRVRAVNANGVSEPSNVKSADVKPPFNEATGGDQTGTFVKDGKTYKYHLFTKSGVLNVVKAINPFQVAVAGGGGGSGNNTQSATNGGGGAGGLIVNNALPLDATTYDVVVGGGGGARQNGGESRFGTLVTCAGGGHGGGWPDQNNEDPNAWTGGGGGSGGGGGGQNNASGGAGAGIPGQGFNGGGKGEYGGPAGGGGAGGPGGQGGNRYSDCCGWQNGGPGVAVNMTGQTMVLCSGGRAAVGSSYGGGGAGGCGGSVGGGQQGVVIVTYEVSP